MCCACIVVSLPSLKLLLKYRHMKSNPEYDFSGSITRPTDPKSAEHIEQISWPACLEAGEDISQVVVTQESRHAPSMIEGHD
jgi:hypothetical protein